MANDFGDRIRNAVGDEMNEGMMKFNIDEFKRSLLEFKKLKEEHPYRRCEWATNDGLAKRCLDVMNKLRDSLASMLGDMHVEGAKVLYSRGAGFFPRNPWLGVIFDGEAFTDGVYPVITLYEDGLIIACVESIARPQGDFQRDYCFSSAEIGVGRKRGVDPVTTHVDEHTSRNARWHSFNKLDELSERWVKEAFATAIDEYECFRKRKTRRVSANMAVGVQTSRENTGWFGRETVTNILDWIDRVSRDVGRIVFRGQGDARWRLETGLDRLFAEEIENHDADIGSQELAFESNSMSEFHRESARLSEYAAFSGVDLLSLMQHYKGKTRLLDFTFSPLVALFFALEQYRQSTGAIKTFNQYHPVGDGWEDERKIEDIAVWAVDISSFKLPDVCDGVQVPLYGASIGSPRIRNFNDFRADANEVIGSGSSSCGIDVIVPKVNNDRSSAQEGLFLMPRRLGESFETNLKCAIHDSPSVGTVVTRYDFPVSAIDGIQQYLNNHRITAKQLFPGIEGLAESLNWKKKLFSVCDDGRASWKA